MINPVVAVVGVYGLQGWLIAHQENVVKIHFDMEGVYIFANNISCIIQDEESYRYRLINVLKKH